uniref:Variant surface glycoprotein 1125.1127 n=1 Tax=Trypanosoma brucei TaxID=5691 RepID=M4T1V7_9TRYP|nr:variant surface glycoprotein 508 [Trypanosoma brucei]APD73386.1 variant surface glycoprotein 1125.1127 [Trypanosoma brucei]
MFKTKASAALTLVFICIEQHANAQAQETSITAVTTPCHELQYQTKLIGHFEGQLQAASNNFKDLAADFTQLTISHACSTSPPRKQAVAALLAATADALHEQEAIIRTSSEPLTKLLAALKDRRAQTKALIKSAIRELTLSSGSNTQTTQAGLSRASDEQCDVAATGAAKDDDACDTEVPTGAHKDATSITELATIENIQLVPDTRFNPPTYKLKIASAGDIDGSAGSMTVGKPGACAVTPADDSNTVGQLTKAFGIVSATRDMTADTPKKTTLFKPAGKNAGCEDENTDDKKLLTTTKRLAALLCRHRTINIKTVARPLQKSKKDLETHGTFRKIAQLFKNRETNSAEEESKQTSAVKALLPGGEATLTSDLIDPLVNEHISYKADNGMAKVNLKEANSAGKIATTLAFCFVKEHAAKVAAGAQKTKTDTKAEEKCKEDTEKDKCTEDKDCEHKEGKCKLKEGIKVENDWKATNTTGINSVVIKKPLWLVFFFLS